MTWLTTAVTRRDLAMEKIDRQNSLWEFVKYPAASAIMIFLFIWAMFDMIYRYFH